MKILLNLNVVILSTAAKNECVMVNLKITRKIASLSSLDVLMQVVSNGSLGEILITIRKLSVNMDLKFVNSAKMMYQNFF